MTPSPFLPPRIRGRAAVPAFSAGRRRAGRFHRTPQARASSPLPS
ncbi:hypothetical protein QRO11_19020 [Paracidovorax citrulli]|uniref:Uncharacterized protein n=1 Tax=Paracidovorax citrulli TaxID=80869 RepID=A0ABY9AMV9_PARCI|nr:hypothetical protein [Paracidovorax citrulli]WIY28541.1 hypothetical protein QRO09_15960 [Paracidovorax citrulli]WIY34010.1 hypothetical protein QRO11_19020 [Paracidovorax citrulli]WIY37772.1 hypothetical protein QRO10_16225 [Paracidovorax citrulli]WIY45013.1 hypothetical protein QRO12_04830 [Paracidovorax citrulli]WIY48095.1 hypothetical protein QRO08_20070 [Paracidovorax citrulli]